MFIKRFGSSSSDFCFIGDNVAHLWMWDVLLDAFAARGQGWEHRLNRPLASRAEAHSIFRFAVELGLAWLAGPVWLAGCLGGLLGLDW